MKVPTLSAFVTLFALFASVTCADEPPAGEKSNTNAQVQTIQSNSAEVAVDQVQATYDNGLEPLGGVVRRPAPQLCHHDAWQPVWALRSRRSKPPCALTST